jgi:hypothetical protein
MKKLNLDLKEIYEQGSPRGYRWGVAPLEKIFWKKS